MTIARAHHLNHVCHGFAWRETQNVTNGIDRRSEEEIQTLSVPECEYEDPRNKHECHVHAGEWLCPRCGERIGFDPIAFGRGLRDLNKSQAAQVVSRFTPTRFADGSKPPPGTWRAMTDTAYAAYRDARREVYPARKVSA